MLVEKTLSCRMQADQAVQQFIARQKAGVRDGLADWHPALASGGRGEKAG
ncbi:hypothetical protein X770_31410 [Mesorhizobium sp. LSJC269B00]|nr:hypothetical protein X770_31410 [Mesorhizobium sp. LSJC269B00]